MQLPSFNHLLKSAWMHCILAVILPAFCGCQTVTYPNPTGYHFDQPQRFFLGDALHEISGIVLFKKNPDSVYAIEDEDGKLFSFHPGDGKYPRVKFGKKGDFEDVTILNDQDFVVLRSDGSLFMFPVSQARSGKLDSIHEFLNILPEGEYEGLSVTEDGRVIAMCKNCPVDKHKEVTLYTLEKKDGRLSVAGNFKIKITKEEGLESEKKKLRFHPSGLAQHPLTHQWYVLSSVNKALVIFDAGWNFVELYELDPSLFKQPEGITFDARGNLYISNEGKEGTATLLIFPYGSK